MRRRMTGSDRHTGRLTDRGVQGSLLKEEVSYKSNGKG